MERPRDTLGHGIIGRTLPLVVILALGVLSVLPATGAPQPGKVYKIGVLHPGIGSEERLAALREAGYVEGQNLVIERRHAQGRVERLPVLARELVGLKPDIILATADSAIQAAKNATKSIPILDGLDKIEQGGEIPGQRHLAPGRAPEAFAAAVMSFIADVVRGSVSRGSS